jgi:hypothetical protein
MRDLKATLLSLLFPAPRAPAPPPAEETVRTERAHPPLFVEDQVTPSGSGSPLSAVACMGRWVSYPTPRKEPTLRVRLEQQGRARARVEDRRDLGMKAAMAYNTLARDLRLPKKPPEVVRDLLNLLVRTKAVRTHRPLVEDIFAFLASSGKRGLRRAVASSAATYPREQAPGKPDALTAEEWSLAIEGRKIQAIKTLRARTGLSLFDAKRLVDEATAGSR